MELSCRARGLSMPSRETRGCNKTAIFLPLLLRPLRIRLAPRRVLAHLGVVPARHVARVRVERGKELVGPRALAFAHLLVCGAVLVEPVERPVALLAPQLVEAQRLPAAPHAGAVDLAR